MKVSMPRGRSHGWGIAGEYLSREIAKLPYLEGVTLHCMRGNDFQPFEQDAWNRINIGYCFFEDAITVQNYTQEAGKRWDMIVGGSRWCEYQLRIGGVNNCATILQGVDQEQFYPGTKKLNRDAFVVFSGGKFEIRKAQDLVIAAMKIFMEKYEDVILASAWHNQWSFSMATMEQSNHIAYQHREGEFQQILAETLAANGIPLERVLLYPPMDNSLMREIYLNTDIGLFPNRCEGGNNMVMCEYMACGRTVIASSLTGHADVITEDNAYPLLRCKPQYFKHYAEGVWFEAEITEILEHLEYAYHHRKELRLKGIKAITDMANLSWQESARRFHAIGETLLNSRRDR